MIQDFNFHTHSERCGHAEKNYTDEDYIKEAIQAGMKYLCFTDHMPYTKEMDYPKTQRMGYETKKEYLETINNLKEKYRDIIKIESGFEVEYIPGKELHLKELKNETNRLIIGQHIVMDNNRDIKDIDNEMSDEDLRKYADLIVKGVELGIPDIIAHPDLFMKFRKNFGKEEEKASIKICEVASKYDIPVEINLGKIHNRFRKINEDERYKDLPYEERLKKTLKIIGYPCVEFWNIASKYNLKAVYGGDVHFKGQLTKMQKYIEIANGVIGEENLSKLRFINENLETL